MGAEVLMDTLVIETATARYPVHVGPGLRHRLGELIPSGASSFFVLTDDHVGPLYLQDVVAALAGAAPVHAFVVSAGESAKSLATYKRVIDELVRLNLDRRACIIALGGGVVGDLAGFAAATYLRGVAYVQMPTTLLAHDSSVGGKVGINHESGKNLIGAFYHPRAVIYDTETLDTLPEREWRSGFAEVIKHALIDSPSFYEELKKAVPDAAALNAAAIRPWLGRAIAVKARIVKEDEKEAGVRAFLNFGHTLGHALEKASGYDRLRHGEAVAIGMIFAMRLSETFYGLRLDVDGIREWFRRLKLPTEIPADLSGDDVLEAMRKDKKRHGNQLVFVLLNGIGRPRLESVPEPMIRKLLKIR